MKLRGLLVCLLVLLLTLTVGAVSANAAIRDMPVGNGLTDVTISTAEANQFKLVIPAGAPQLTTIEIQAPKELKSAFFGSLSGTPYVEDEDDDDISPYDPDFWNVNLKVSGSKAVAKGNLCLNPGTYYLILHADEDEMEASSATIKLGATLKAVTRGYDAEPNHITAQTLTLGESVSGVLATMDVDHFKFTLNADAKVKFTVKQELQNFYIYLSTLKKGYTDADVQAYYDAWYKDTDTNVPDPLEYFQNLNTKKVPASANTTLSLPAGTYYILTQFTESMAAKSQYAYYTLKVEATGDPITKLVMPKTFKMPVGFVATINPSMKPSLFSAIPVSFSSSKTSVATVEATTGQITAVAPGTTTIKVTALDNSKTAKMTLTVVAADKNKFSRKKPLGGTYKAIYTSTKSLKYDGTTLVADVFVYNKTKKTVNLSTLNSMDGLKAYLYDMDALNIGFHSENKELKVIAMNPVESKSVKAGKYGIITVKFEGVPGLNLVSGRYNVVVQDDDEDLEIHLNYGKSVSGLLPEMKGVREEFAAQPDAAFMAEALNP